MKNRNLIDSFNNAISGIIYAIKSEKNMKIHIITAFCVLVMSLLYGLSSIEFLIICLTICMVIVCELFNTAVEVIVDIIIDVYHPKAKIVKDVAAGAVLVASFVSVIVAYLIFFKRVSTSFKIGLNIIKQSPLHITVIALLITIILVLVIKALNKSGTPVHGGMPSGHSAIATSITTAIALWTVDINIIMLSVILTVLVIESRLETKIHNIYEVVAGMFIGFIITLLLFQMFFWKWKSLFTIISGWS